MNRKLHTSLLRRIVLNLVFILLSVLALLPILYALKVSLNAQNSILTTGVSLLPEKITFQHYFTVLVEKPFLIWLKNSTLLSISTMLVSLCVAVPGAYAFSRFRFPGRKATLYLLLMLNAFPAILSMFATYRILKTLGLINSGVGLVVVYAGTMAIFGIWNMKGYFDSIPIEIEEAAQIDGAGDFAIIRSIILPLATPSIIVTAVMTLIYVWNEYIFAVQFLTGSENYTLATGLYSLQATEYTRNWPLFSAASILVSLPVLIIFYVIQKYMVSGLTAGGVKN